MCRCDGDFNLVYIEMENVLIKLFNRKKKNDFAIKNPNSEPSMAKSMVGLL